MGKIYLKLLPFIFSIGVSAQSPKIYSISRDSAYVSSIVSYDWLTNIETTEFDFYANYGDITYTNFNCSSDVLNGRYFFQGGCDSMSGHRIFIFDITTNTFSWIGEDYPFNFNELEYDMYNNRFLFRHENELKSIDIPTEAVTTICALPPKNGNWWGTSRAFDPVNQYYFENYFNGTFPSDGADSCEYCLVDVTNGTVLSKNVFDMDHAAASMVFDPGTMSFYSVVSDGNLVSIDPFTAEWNFIAHVPNDNGHYNAMMASFDHSSGNYSVGYRYDETISHTCKLATINVVSGDLISYVDYHVSDFNKVFQDFEPPLRVVENVITAPYGKEYSWFLNDELIEDSTGQTIHATLNGNYRAEILFFTKRKLRSNSVLLAPELITGIKPEKSRIYPYPNPSRNSVTFDFSTLKGKSFMLKIFNGTGQLRKVVDKIQANSFSIDKEEFGNGVYFYELVDATGNITTGRFVFI